MRRISRRMPWVEFAVALCVLLAVAFASDNVTARLLSDERIVSHTHEVETKIAQVRAETFATGDARQVFILTGDRSVLATFGQASTAIPSLLDDLGRLTVDNPSQQARIATLRSALESQVGLLTGSINLRESTGQDLTQQTEWTQTGEKRERQILEILDQMNADEDTLLKSRQLISAETYWRVRMVLVVSFAAIVLLLLVNFRDLSKELKERKAAEDAVLRMSGRILRVQDAERRRIARELHDSIGQVFALLKMNLEMIAGDRLSGNPQRRGELLNESIQALSEGLSGARTLSHLLHPPLLDEMGFSSAAKWLVSGFSQRSNIQVKLEIPEDLPRMPEEVELTLFRILQESLTNIHKHSASLSAEIQVSADRNAVVLRIIDFGKGIPAEVIERFHRSHPGLGVGLAGMQERVRHLGGRIELTSASNGSVVEASIPLLGQPAALSADADLSQGTTKAGG